MNHLEPILITGTGAMACLFAAKLSAAGFPVTVLGTWQDGLAALSQHGVRVVDAQGNEQAFPVKVARELEDCECVRFALVLVKTWQTTRAAAQLKECLHPEGIALSLQNGLGNREKLANQLGEERVAVGVTTSGATLVGPGRVRAAGNGKITIGNTPRLALYTGLLTKAGLSIEVTQDEASMLWGKLLINAAINPLTAILNIPNGELLHLEPARLLMVSTALEVARVAHALGIRLPFSDPVAAVEHVVQNTAANRSSMLQDLERGAPTEIEAICGAIVETARTCNETAAMNEALLNLVLALRGRWTDNECLT